MTGTGSGAQESSNSAAPVVVATQAPARITLKLSQIRLDGDTQPRAAMSQAAVDDYSDAMWEGVKFPPVVVFYDGTDYWLADGFHRRDAAFAAGFTEIECDVHQGTLQNAQWYSFAANKTNGLRRTNNDKERAVKAALTHPNATGLRDRKIAEHVGVSHEYVRQMRLPLSTVDSQKRMGRDGRTINTANIGKSKPKPAPIQKPAPPLVDPSPVVPAAPTTPMEPAPDPSTVLDPAMVMADPGRYTVSQRSIVSALLVPRIKAELDVRRHNIVDARLKPKEHDPLLADLPDEALKGAVEDVAGKLVSISQSSVNLGKQLLHVDQASAHDVASGNVAITDAVRAVQDRIPNRRQEIQDNASKQKMVIALSQIGGLCEELSALDTSGMQRCCTPEEIKTWADQAQQQAKQLEVFAARLRPIMARPVTSEAK